MGGGSLFLGNLGVEERPESLKVANLVEGLTVAKQLTWPEASIGQILGA